MAVRNSGPDVVFQCPSGSTLRAEATFRGMSWRAKSSPAISYRENVASARRVFWQRPLVFSFLAFGGREEYKGRETSDSKEEFCVSQF